MSDCPFCEIARGKRDCHLVWEGPDHLAFLAPKPRTVGMTVLITKAHHPSDALELDDETLAALVVAAKSVSRLLKFGFDDVGRVGLVLEGFGVDHVHAKLYPLHGTAMEGWKPILSGGRGRIELYRGEICSGDGPPADPAGLAALADRIRNACSSF